MFSTFSKILMVMLICSTFIGQTMASTVMSYRMVSMKMMSGSMQSHKMSTMSVSGINTSHHMMKVGVMVDSDSVTTLDSNIDMELKTNSDDDCCAESCHCFAGSCSSFITLDNHYNNHLMSDFSTKITFYTRLTQDQLLTSLYRPPIQS